MNEEDTSIPEAVKTGLTLASVIIRLSKNRIEYAVFTLLADTVGLLDKVLTYGQDICM